MSAISVAKLFFAYGLGNAMTFPLSVGATTVLLPDRPTPEIGGGDSERPPGHGVLCGTHLLCGIPGEPGRAAARGVEVALLRLRRRGAAARVGRRWSERYGVDILDGLGSTEMLHIFLSNRPGDVKYGTTGKPVPGYDMRIVDDDGALRAARRDGRVAGARSDQRGHVLE